MAHDKKHLLSYFEVRRCLRKARLDPLRFSPPDHYAKTEPGQAWTFGAGRRQDQRLAGKVLNVQMEIESSTNDSGD